jgi:tetratricopeptide (TPR) repeat protein
MRRKKSRAVERPTKKLRGPERHHRELAAAGLPIPPTVADLLSWATAVTSVPPPGAGEPASKATRQAALHFLRAAIAGAEPEALRELSDDCAMLVGTDGRVGRDIVARLLDRVPDDGRLWALLGRAWEEGGDWREARDAYRHAWEHGARDEETLYRLGWALIVCGDREEAARLIESRFDAASSPAWATEYLRIARSPTTALAPHVLGWTRPTRR